VEDVIQALPGVESVVVIGIPHEDYNEIPKAFVVKQPGSSITEEDITRIVEGNQLKFKKTLHIPNLFGIYKTYTIYQSEECCGIS